VLGSFGEVFKGLLLDDREDLVLTEDQVLDPVDLDLGAAVLAEEDAVACLDLERAHRAVLKDLALPTATISPSTGFSLAVSGMMRPLLVVVSASRRFTMMRSYKGRIFIVQLLRRLRLRVDGALCPERDGL